MLSSALPLEPHLEATHSHNPLPRTTADNKAALSQCAVHDLAPPTIRPTHRSNCQCLLTRGKINAVNQSAHSQRTTCSNNKSA